MSSPYIHHINIYRQVRWFFCIATAALTFCVTVATGPLVVRAATIIFDPQETTVGTASPFKLGISIASDKPLNAVSVVIDLPYPLEVVDYSDGDSIINFWTSRPHVNDAGKVEFAGIIPGGFVGKKGSRLVTLFVKASKPGTYDVDLDWTSKAYVNAPGAPEEILSARPVTLVATLGRDNLANDISDIDSPEQFTPTLIQADTESSNSWQAVFSTVDKGSGMDRFEMAESRRAYTPLSALGAALAWHVVDSPVTLSDQALTSYVYVKAVDKKGNARVEIIPPAHPVSWYRSAGWYILVVLLVVAVLLRALRCRK